MPYTNQVPRPCSLLVSGRTRSKPCVSAIDAGHEAAFAEASGSSAPAAVGSPLGADFNVSSSTVSQAQMRAAFYPKFENEKTDKEVRRRMIEMVSRGQAILEVSLKHSGSLFMYAGHEGGAYAKNSFGNIYTAVGVFVLSRTFLEEWGAQARRKQVEFNDFLEKNRVCVSMELVTAVLGDHGERPIDDYVVVTAVAELGHGKPKFYSSLDLVAFCRKWRLPTNHVWFFCTRKSVSSFFAVYDALREEGTATPVCKSLDEVADISVPGSKDYIKVQGEILEGLVARTVSYDSSTHIEKVLNNSHPPPSDGVGLDLGPSLREICAANRSDEKQQIKALLESAGSRMCPDFCDWFGNGTAIPQNADPSILSKFLEAHPMDLPTMKLQAICEMVIHLCHDGGGASWNTGGGRRGEVAEPRKEEYGEEMDELELVGSMKKRHFPAALKCYCNFHKINSLSCDNLNFKMVIHVCHDSFFRRYQQAMRNHIGSWPLYRGFFVDVNLRNTNKDSAAELASESTSPLKNISGSCDSSSSLTDEPSDENENLMIKLKFLTYKLRTFLIRNGLPVLFKRGPSAYKIYYMRQLNNWTTSDGKKMELSKMLDEWALYIQRKCRNKQLSSSTYLTEAEPYLDQYAKLSPENHALVGSAGNFVRAEDFLAITNRGRGGEGDHHDGPLSSIMDKVQKNDGLIIFFPGLPGCAKSALCKEILNIPDGLGDNRPVQNLMGDLIKGGYWQKVANECKKKPHAITLADKNAPNEEVWKRIKSICRSTKANAVPVVPCSEGTDSNPFSLDALAVFIFRVLQRINHPGNLDRDAPNAGYVLLMFYHLYDGKNSKEFQSELLRHFGALVKMPLLKVDRGLLPDPLKDILEEGINLYKLHTSRHGRLESSKGSYAEEWVRWETQLREVLFQNADHLISIQVPFDVAAKQVIEQLKDVAIGEYKTPVTEETEFGNPVFAAVTLSLVEITSLLEKVADKDLEVKCFLKDKKTENHLVKAHITLAHRRSHGIAAVASYSAFLHQTVPVDFTALLFSDTVVALEGRLGAVNGERISSKNKWVHATIWTAAGTTPKEANKLPHLLSKGNATRVVIEPPVTVSGVLNFY